MHINNLSPYIRVAMDHTMVLGYDFSPRVIFDYELLYVKAGKAQITIEDKTYMATPGSLFIFKPMQTHSIQCFKDQPFHQPHIHFDFFYQPDSPDLTVNFKPLERMTEQELTMFRKDILPEFGIEIPSKIQLRNPSEFEVIFFDIINEYNEKGPFYQLNVKGLFIQLWTYILRESYWISNRTTAIEYEHLQPVKQYLLHNITKTITIDELSAISNISKYHLIRLFKKAFGIPPIHYHTLLRIQKAKEMILYTRYTLSEIAEITGFSSIHQFSRTFKNIEGVPPSYYRMNKMIANTATM